MIFCLLVSRLDFFPCLPFLLPVHGTFKIFSSCTCLCWVLRAVLGLKAITLRLLLYWCAYSGTYLCICSYLYLIPMLRIHICCAGDRYKLYTGICLYTYCRFLVCEFGVSISGQCPRTLCFRTHFRNCLAMCCWYCLPPSYICQWQLLLTPLSCTNLVEDMEQVTDDVFLVLLFHAAQICVHCSHD